MRALWLAMTLSLALRTLAGTAEAQSGSSGVPVRVVPPAEVVLGEGQSAELGASGSPGAVVVTFRGVTSDSRCPRNVQCVWAGEVVVRLTYAGGATGELSLTLPGSEAAPAAADAGRYRISLLEVTPYPIHGEPRAEPTRVRLGVVVRP